MVRQPKTANHWHLHSHLQWKSSAISSLPHTFMLLSWWSMVSVTLPFWSEIQFHPVTDAVLHVDFYEVNDTKPIVMGVPVKLQGLAQGVRDGGRMNLSIRKINVRAPFQQIPEHLDIDVTKLRLGKSIKVGELSFEASWARNFKRRCRLLNQGHT